MSKIEWTGITWNPTTGCTKISQGCKNCYAEKMHKRLSAMGQAKYLQPFTKVVTHAGELTRPAEWKKSQMVFVNSMSDLFHKDIPLSFIKQVFEVMNSYPQHTFQVLTKRSGRLAEMKDQLTWTKNIWIGVSVENKKTKSRIEDLKKVTQAKVRFLSLEPLLEDLGALDLKGIDWVIVGGESGPKSREIKVDWVKSIRKACQAQSVAFFFKQWGGKNKKKAGRLLEGKEYNEMPVV